MAARPVTPGTDDFGMAELMAIAMARLFAGHPYVFAIFPKRNTACGFCLSIPAIRSMTL